MFGLTSHVSHLFKKIRGILLKLKKADITSKNKKQYYIYQ